MRENLHMGGMEVSSTFLALGIRLSTDVILYFLKKKPNNSSLNEAVHFALYISHINFSNNIFSAFCNQTYNHGQNIWHKL